MSELKNVTIVGSGTTRRITLERQLEAPIEKVWQAITSIDALKQWWVDWQDGGKIEQEEGGRIILGDGSWINGSIKIWAPPHVFSFTWHESLADPQNTIGYDEKTKGLLRIDLIEANADQTFLTLIQFLPAADTVGGAAGWHYFGEILFSYLKGEKITYRTDRFEELKSLYAR
ncbi:MAG: SRPBCC domain-containing protein [Pseudomonadota bacterium]